MGPDVEGLIGELEETEDAIGGWAARVPVAGDDAVLVENLRVEKKKNSVCQLKCRCVVHQDGWFILAQITNTLLLLKNVLSLYINLLLAGESQVVTF